MRQSGILLHISSLPNRYGIGSFGHEAFEFVDYLKKAHQSLWQILPLGPTSYGDSPYQTFSAFALNHYFIDLDTLVEEKLLRKSEIVMHKTSSSDINYAALYEDRLPILRHAFNRFKKNSIYERFIKEQSYWLYDYAFYMAIKLYFKGNAWNTWPEDIKMRYDYAIKYYQDLLQVDIDFHMFLQFKAYQQWMKLKKYANKKGISIIGDIPIYVAYDSSEVWTKPHFFLLDEHKNMSFVAGVPPDGFSADGQLWGNPLYNWNDMKHDGYSFWIERVRSQMKMFDHIRIDHFIGFEHYYKIPAHETTARNGYWVDGPSIDLFQHIKQALGTLNIIAEDLGRVTLQVVKLLENTGFPGMKLMHNAFYDEGNGQSLPLGFPYHSIAYTGTHDNETTKMWYKHLNTKQKAHVRHYLNLAQGQSVVDGMIRETLKSNSMMAIIPFQDYLELGEEGRMNEPSTIGKNWRYRALKKDFSPSLNKRIKQLTKLYARDTSIKQSLNIQQ